MYRDRYSQFSRFGEVGSVVAYKFYLSLPAAFTQPDTLTEAELLFTNM